MDRGEAELLEGQGQRQHSALYQHLAAAVEAIKPLPRKVQMEALAGVLPIPERQLDSQEGLVIQAHIVLQREPTAAALTRLRVLNQPLAVEAARHQLVAQSVNWLAALGMAALVLLRQLRERQ